MTGLTIGLLKSIIENIPDVYTVEFTKTSKSKPRSIHNVSFNLAKKKVILGNNMEWQILCKIILIFNYIYDYQ